MASRNLTMTVRPAMGGLDITSDPTILDPEMLIQADNITYKEGGQRKRRSGFIQYAPTTSYAGTVTNVMISSGAAVRGIIDTWDYSTGTLTPVQRLVAGVRRSLYRSTGDGLWTPVTTGSSFSGGNIGTPVSLTQAQNYVVYSNTNSTAPIAYNLATTVLVGATTGALWPPFESSVYHDERLWMFGISTAPSQIRASAAGNIFDSTGTDSFTASIDNGDGDRVIGASQTFFENLFVFKGPQYGSIHRISGNTSTNYTKQKIISGAPAVNAQCIITTPTDIYWMSNYGVHSLQTTLKFGDVQAGYLSLPIQALWRDQTIDLANMVTADAVWNPTKNYIAFTVPIVGQTNKWILVYNYALSDPTPGGKKFWSIWKLNATMGNPISMGMILGTTGMMTSETLTPHLVLGTNAGLAYIGDYGPFEDDGTPYNTTIKTPVITRFKASNGAVIPETQEKQFSGIVTYYDVNDSQNTGNIDYATTVDNRAAGAGSFSMNGAGGILGAFIVGTGILGGISFNYQESIIEGRGRGIQLTWSQSVIRQDFEHLGYSIRYAPTETDARESA